MKKAKFAAVLLLWLISLGPRYERYTATFWGAFDTMFTITADAVSKQQFDAFINAAAFRFTELSLYYDRFSLNDDVVNFAYINENAFEQEIAVNESIMSLLLYGQRGYARTEGLVNPLFGAVTELWRVPIASASEFSAPPSDAKLSAANEDTSIELLKTDDKNGTVRLLSNGALLDVGAFAKGYATEVVGRELTEAGLSRVAISSGGNIRAFYPPHGKSGWKIGIQNPSDAIFGTQPSVAVIYADNIAVATSGGYQRYFVHEGKRYHHLIDPKTLYPAEYFLSVTVACESAADADLFSTALFVTDIKNGMRIAEREKLAVLWITNDGEVIYNSLMEKLLKKK